MEVFDTAHGERVCNEILCAGGNAVKDSSIKTTARLYHQLRSSITRRMIILVFALGALIAAFFIFAQITGTFITPTVLRTMLAQFGVLAPLALIVMLAGVLVIPIVPAVVFQIGAGLIFGPWFGLIYTLVADFLGASTGFLLARYWGKALLTRFLSPEAQTQLANLTARMS